MMQQEETRNQDRDSTLHSLRNCDRKLSSRPVSAQHGETGDQKISGIELEEAEREPGYKKKRQNQDFVDRHS